MWFVTGLLVLSLGGNMWFVKGPPFPFLGKHFEISC